MRCDCLRIDNIGGVRNETIPAVFWLPIKPGTFVTIR